MWDAVRDLVQAGVGVVLTTQYLEEADQLAGRVMLLDDGRIVAEGTATATAATYVVPGVLVLCTAYNAAPCSESGAGARRPDPLLRDVRTGRARAARAGTRSLCAE
jgi:ABC-type multidrug transport system ATPase subunit